MARAASLLITWAVTLALGVALAGQGLTSVGAERVAPQQPPRDSPQRPAGRRIPVGAAVISGTVVSADTGRPVRNARVSVSGVAGGMSQTGRGATGPPTGAAGPGMLPLSRVVMTDAQGRFAFLRLAAGSYSIAVNHENYLTASYGQRRPGGPGTTFQLADGQQVSVTIPLARGGVITGRVYDEEGDPVRSANVQAWRVDVSSGVRRLQPGGGGTTDDRGTYRVFGLQPGQYLVSATPRPGMGVLPQQQDDIAAIEAAIASGRVQPGSAPGEPAFVTIPQAAAAGPISFGGFVGTGGFAGIAGFLPIYYPGTAEPGTATFVTVGGDDEHGPLDILLRRVQATRIQGRIATAVPEGVMVRVALQNGDPMLGSQTMQSSLNQGGIFQFPSVAPGRYILLAQMVAGTVPEMRNGSITMRQGVIDDTRRWFAREEILVSGEPLIELTLALQPGRTVTGRMIFDMTRPPDLARTRPMLSLTPSPGALTLTPGPPQATVEPDGSFTIKGVAPGEYLLRGAGLTLRSAMVDGVDTLDVPLVVTGDRDVTGMVVTVTDRTTELWGTVTGRDGAPAIGETIVVAATDERFWRPGSRRILVVRSTAPGSYGVRNLPPGSYAVGIVDDFENGRQYDPELLQALRAEGRWVTIVEGGTVKEDLRVR